MKASVFDFLHRIKPASDEPLCVLKFVSVHHSNSSTSGSLLGKPLIAINVADSEKQISSKSCSAKETAGKNKNTWDMELDLAAGPKTERSG